MPEPRGAESPGQVPGGNVQDQKSTTGDIRLVMMTIGELGAKIERLITDRKDDKDEMIRKVDEVRTDLRERIDGIRDGLIKGIEDTKGDLRERIEDVRQGHKEFIKEDFRPLRDDVSKLRLKWAWMAGVGAVVGILVGLGVDLLKSHIH